MKKLIFLLPVLLLLSCSKSTVFSETLDDFENNRWQRGDIKVFKFDVKNDIASADIDLMFSHTFDPQYTLVPMDVAINRPDGTRNNMHINFMLQDNEGNNISDCAGDVCDIKMNIIDNKKMDKGTYTITVESKFYGAYLPNILALGINVENND